MNWLRLPLSAVTFALLTLTLALATCGGDEPESTAVDATPEPTQTAEPTSAAKSTSTEAEPTSVAEATPPELTPSPEAAATPEATPVMSDNAAKLAEYAAEHASGPGAVFAGDPMQLVGLPPHEGLMFQASEEQYLQGAPQLRLLASRPWAFPDTHSFTQASTTRT